jgi:hypothetical protein
MYFQPVFFGQAEIVFNQVAKDEQSSEAPTPIHPNQGTLF